MTSLHTAVMGWYARGGSHMNYYMWTGGNNYGRWTGDSITHMYAVDAILCPDGLRHEPKFSYTTAMHSAIAVAAGDIANNPAQLDNAVIWKADNNNNNNGGGGGGGDGPSRPHLDAYIYGDYAFVENLNGNKPLTSTQHGKTFTVSAGGTSPLHAGCSTRATLTEGTFSPFFYADVRLILMVL